MQPGSNSANIHTGVAGSKLVYFVLPGGERSGCHDSQFDLLVTVRSGDGSYSIKDATSQQPTIQAVVAAEIDHRWVKSSDFPARKVSESKFEDALGAGHQITVTATGIENSPSLIYIVRLYDAQPSGEIEVEVRNDTAKPIEIQSIRSVEAIGKRPIYLGEKESADRILSDSFSEDWPPLQIYDLGKAPHGLHFGVGSQLIYNRDSGQSLFFGALSSDRFLTILHLTTGEDSSKQADRFLYRGFDRNDRNSIHR